MPAASASLLLAALIYVVVETSAVPPSTTGVPCPDIFQYEEVSKDEWKAKLTVISDEDLHGVWVRLLTQPKLVDVVVSNGFQVKHTNDTPEVRLSNRDFELKAFVPFSLTVSGKIVDGKTPELISVILNGKLICASEKHLGSFLYNGDFNNKKYLPSISQNNVNQATTKSSKCGKALLLNSLIPNDNVKVLPGAWPWQAGLFKTTNSSESLLCEATLVSENTLITSAHCVTWEDSRRPIPSNLLTIRLKNLNVEEKNEDDTFKVKTIIIHPGFNEKNLNNDIALIKLEKSATIDDGTQPICMPSIKKLPEEAYVLGYGFRQDGTLANLGVAKTVPLADEKCVELEPAYKSLVNDDNYCAAYVQDHEVCIGSSGSGVMDVKSDSELTWELRGVLSLGRALQEKFSCGQTSPVLIVDVSKHSKWIVRNSK